MAWCAAPMWGGCKQATFGWPTTALAWRWAWQCTMVAIVDWMVGGCGRVGRCCRGNESVVLFGSISRMVQARVEGWMAAMCAAMQGVWDVDCCEVWSALVWRGLGLSQLVCTLPVTCIQENRSQGQGPLRYPYWKA